MSIYPVSSQEEVVVLSQESPGQDHIAAGNGACPLYNEAFSFENQHGTDIIIVSCDHQRFYCHKENLRVFSKTFGEMFACFDGETPEVLGLPTVPVSESGLLLSYVLPCFYP